VLTSERSSGKKSFQLMPWKRVDSCWW